MLKKLKYQGGAVCGITARHEAFRIEVSSAGVPPAVGVGVPPTSGGRKSDAANKHLENTRRLLKAIGIVGLID